MSRFEVADVELEEVKGEELGESCSLRVAQWKTEANSSPQTCTYCVQCRPCCCVGPFVVVCRVHMIKWDKGYSWFWQAIGLVSK